MLLFHGNELRNEFRRTTSVWAHEALESDFSYSGLLFSLHSNVPIFFGRKRKNIFDSTKRNRVIRVRLGEKKEESLWRNMVCRFVVIDCIRYSRVNHMILNSLHSAKANKNHLKSVLFLFVVHCCRQYQFEMEHVVRPVVRLVLGMDGYVFVRHTVATCGRSYVVALHDARPYTNSFIIPFSGRIGYGYHFRCMCNKRQCAHSQIFRFASFLFLISFSVSCFISVRLAFCHRSMWPFFFQLCFFASISSVRCTWKRVQRMHWTVTSSLMWVAENDVGNKENRMRNTVDDWYSFCSQWLRISIPSICIAFRQSPPYCLVCHSNHAI